MCTFDGHIFILRAIIRSRRTRSDREGIFNDSILIWQRVVTVYEGLD